MNTNHWGDDYTKFLALHTEHLVFHPSFPKIHERSSVVNFYFRAFKADIMVDDFSFQ